MRTTKQVATQRIPLRIWNPSIFLLLAACMLSTAASARSVLATTDQQSLDAQAIAIQSTYGLSFSPFVATAQTAYLAGYELGPVIPIPQDLTSLDNAMTELTFNAVQKAVDSDSQYPKVYWVDAVPHDGIPGGRYSYDNPDDVFRIIPIDGSSSYVINGQRTGNGPTDVTFSLVSNPNSQQTISVLTNNELVVNPDGSYVITIDSSPANGRVNHIQSTSAAAQLIVRNNLGNWNVEVPDALTIVLTSTPSRAPLSTADIVAAVDENLTESALDYGAGTMGLETYSHPVNTLPAPTTSSTLGTLTTQYDSFGYFELCAGQALVVTVNTGGAGYFVLPVTDPWTITVDPINHQSSLNTKQALPNADGTYTFVVSAQDPGVYNWIDTDGLSDGTIMARWQDLPAITPAGGGPAISTQVVALSDLSSYLPARTQYVTATQREQQLEQRQAGYAWRLATP
jgi:hypothetical protein